MDKKLNILIKTVLILLIITLFFNIYDKVLSFLKILFNIILPFLIGFTIAFILNPLVTKLEKKGCNRKIVSVMLLIILLLILFIIIFYLSPALIKEGNNLLDNLPNYIQNIKEIFHKIFKKINISLFNQTKISDNLLIIIVKFITEALQTTFSYIISIIIGFVLSLYFLIDYHKIINVFKEYLINKKKNNLILFFKEIEKTMYAYFKGIIFVVIILSLISSFSFIIIGINLPFLWGVVIGLTNVIPYIGPYIGGVIVGIFTLGSAPEKLIYVVIVIIILQLIESNFITPKVESKTINTHPILVILCMSIFSKMLGIIGLLLAVPLLSVIQISFQWKNLTKIWKK